MPDTSDSDSTTTLARKFFKNPSGTARSAVWLSATFASGTICVQSPRSVARKDRHAVTLPDAAARCAPRLIRLLMTSAPRPLIDDFPSRPGQVGHVNQLEAGLDTRRLRTELTEHET